MYRGGGLRFITQIMQSNTAPVIGINYDFVFNRIDKLFGFGISILFIEFN